MKKYLVLVLFFLSFRGDTKDINWSAFIDSYYAYDFNNPPDREREYTTQPSRHNEFSINLAYLDLELKESKRRGRLALQWGTSVDANYAAEPNNNIQIIQEAYAGVKIADRLWVDGGIFLSHIGIESFISKYNTNYSRSLNADNVPYYQAGLRFDFNASSTENFQLHILNGWQRINENNTGKAIGGQFKKQLKEGFTFTYNNFFGDELQTTERSRFRTYHNLILENALTDRYIVQASFDLGTQAQEKSTGVDTWFASSLILGQKISEFSRMGYRLEFYLDPAEANVVTTTAKGFEVISASTNYDKELAKETIWRSEIRGFYSKHEIYKTSESDKGRWNAVAVSSIALSF
jgi:hypothetical protein